MKAGLVLLIAGGWVLCQILGGQALQRLNIISGGDQPGAGAGSSSGGTSSTPPPSSGGVIGSGTA